MYYSPKKNIETFIESKNEEIKTLKQKILGSRVTYEDMEVAKSRLTSLKSSHLQLQKEDHLDLKQVLKTSLQAVNELVKKKNRLLQQLETQQKQSQDMCDLECELMSKNQKADQFYKEVCTIQDKLKDKKDKKNRQILDLEEEISTRRKQLAMEREIGDELEIARTELKTKLNKINIDLNIVTEDNKKLRESIRKQLEQITKLEHEQENSELRVENMQLKIEKQEKTIQNLQLKIDMGQTFMQRFSEDKLIYLKQSETAFNIDSLLKMCTESNEKKYKQQKECQDQINDLEKKIDFFVHKRHQLTNEVNQKQDNLRELKQKGAELKSILNSIFHQDSSVLKLLADKKVYEPEPGLKKSTLVVAPTKQDMLDLAATSDNFFMTT